MFKSGKISHIIYIQSWLILAAIFISQNSFSDISIIASESDKQRPLYELLHNATEKLPNPNRYDIAIAIGHKSLVRVLNSGHRYDSVMVVDVTKYDFNHSIESHPNINFPISAIYAEPPPEKIVKLVRLMYGENARILIPYHSKKKKSLFFSEEIIQDKYITVLPSTNSRWVGRIRDYDAAIAIADIQLHSDSNLKAIGHSMYRQRKGLFGFSSELVTGDGALASLYTQDSQIIKQLLNAISLYFETKTLPLPDHPNRYSIEIKSQLAKTLGFYALDVNMLEIEINKVTNSGGIE